MEVKKTILFAILLIFSTAAISEVIRPIPPIADIEGGEDHPLLKRYADSYIVVDQRKSFDEFTFPLSKLELVGKWNYVGDNPFAPKKLKTVEGPYTRLVYVVPVDRSPLEIIRNYQDEIVGSGGSVLWECKREECGGNHQGGIGKAGRGSTSLATFLRPLERLGLKGYSQGYCATVAGIRDQRYLVAELPDVGAYISVHTYTINNYRFTNCNAFRERTVAVVDIVEGKPREKNMVTVEASDMAQQITETGSVSLYGIFFDTNSATVKDDSEATLQEIAKLFQQQPDLNLLVVGHTDDAGAFQYNMNLSQNRARSVVDELSEKYGVSKERLVPVGVSYASPVSSNETEEGRALNRRVELVKNRAQ
jgi:outer membrane protein OmpA-like peptidoglycan-associated protein